MRVTPAAIVLGGYGTFGRLIAESLARHAEIRVLVAGRNQRAAEEFCRTLATAAAEPLAIDCAAPDFTRQLARLSPAVVIDAVGPFQSRDYAVARSCIELGSHYVDLADSRDYVVGIT